MPVEHTSPIVTAFVPARLAAPGTVLHPAARVVRGGTVIDLPRVVGQDGVFSTEGVPDGATYRLEMPEVGGGMTNTGAAQTIAGLDGAPLPAFRVRGYVHEPHGWFRSDTGLIVASVERQRKALSVALSRVEIRRQGNGTVRAVSVPLWSGTEDDEIPESLEQYTAAIVAAVQKTKCWHCRCLHFYDASASHPTIH